MIDKEAPSAIEGVLVKPPFMSPSKNWMVVVAIVEEVMSTKDSKMYPVRHNVMLIKKRVTLK